MPTASRASSGSWPVARMCSLKKSSGMRTWMPAPSPVLPSASTAPRCHTFFSALMPASTTRRDGLPSVAATRPTPQASCSQAGS